MGTPFLELTDITKTFPGDIIANDAVTLSVARQEVHAILGENGAGKSTLMKILYGFYHPDGGTIALDGQTVAIHSPAQAKALGIGMVFQQFMLIPAFTVVENVALVLASSGFVLQRAALADRITALSDRYGFGLDPWRNVGELSVGDQQKVEIVKLLLEGARLLIFDEPTSVLAPHEVEGLFKVFDRLREDGYTILFITHKLREVLAVADSISVLRRGRVVGTVLRSEATADSLVAMILGTPDGSDYEARRSSEPASGAPVLELRNVSAASERGSRGLHQVSLGIRPGEILGIAGVSGNGQKELGEVILGLQRATAGSVTFNGQDITRWPVGQILAGGIACIPEDPLAMAVVADMKVQENLALGSGKIHDAGGWRPIDWEAALTKVAALAERLHLRLPRMDVPVRTLSGGNVQRLVFIRELAQQPRVLLAYYPSHGLDIGATRVVHQVLQEARDAGVAILLVSEDLDELVAMSDRLAVMFHGELVGEFDPEGVDIGEIGMLMTGGHRQHPIAAAEVPA